jgi:hypothetical protein
MTNIDLALKLRDAAWFPFHPADQGPNGPSQRDLEIIAWAAAVALTDGPGYYDFRKIVQRGTMHCEAFGWYSPDHDMLAQDPDPLRATLLAAVEMEGAK